jgi:hypothetical protein
MGVAQAVELQAVEDRFERACETDDVPRVAALAPSGVVARERVEPFSHANIRIGSDPPSPLLVPPEQLPPLTSEHVTTVLEIARLQGEHAHEREMKVLDMKSKAETNMRSLASICVLGAVVAVGGLIYRGEYALASQIAIPLLTSAAGYLAGVGRERKRQAGSG